MRRFSVPFLATVVAFSGCDPATTETPVAERELLPNGAVLLRYRSLPPPATEPIDYDLRIGVLEGEPHETFGDIRGIEADDEGNIYILDHQASEVRVFDAGGRYLRTLTRKGQGPGELTAANGMILAPDGTLWIQDHGQWRMVGVDLEGEEVGRFPMPVLAYGYVWRGALDDGGRFWKPAAHSDTRPVHPPQPGLNERHARSFMKWLDPATEATDSVFLGEVTSRWRVTEIGHEAWVLLPIPFAPEPIAVVDAAGGFWKTSGESYRVARLDEAGDTILVIEAAVSPAPVTSEDRRRFAESMLERYPNIRRELEEALRLAAEFHPVLDQLMIDDEGRLWVRRRTADDEYVHYDLYTRDGEFLGAVVLSFRPVPRHPPRIRAGKLYAVVADELDVHTVVRASLPPLEAP